MLERPDSSDRAVLVQVHFGQTVDAERLPELAELADTAGLDVVGELECRRNVPDARLFLGEGKADELKGLVAGTDAGIVVFNHDLSPSQQRNLERVIGVRIINRTELILDIFAQRAQSFEGKLQVELAQLNHLSSRLVRGWTHLERQKGGIGLRGPGETQLETDRRLIGQRIKQLREKLDRVRRQRTQGARSRRRAELALVALVGYTNAGKSTLFNALSGARVFAADQLFATLDTTHRRVDVPGEHPVIFSDTVGFIRALPHDLVEAFHATLEETRDADLLLHVIDASASNRDERIEDVAGVLEEIDAGEVPVLQVFNKVDLTDFAPAVERGPDGRPTRVFVSAQTGAGIPQLKQAIGAYINEHKQTLRVFLPFAAGELRARLYQMGAVMHEAEEADAGWRLTLKLAPETLDRLLLQAGLDRVTALAASERAVADQRTMSDLHMRSASNGVE